MRSPTLQGVIERRLLVTYRTDPGVAARLLPAGLRPVVVNGSAVAGICLLRLGAIRPLRVPRALGLRSENAAHRVAVEWDTPDGPRSGVYIHRRDTDSPINVLAGGRVFPGRHSRAGFSASRVGSRLQVAFTSKDNEVSVRVAVRTTGKWTGSELFPDAAAASEFYRRGSQGYSPNGGHIEGMQLCTDDWAAEPVEIDSVASSYFDDPVRFPPGTATLDSALIMENVPVAWRSIPHLDASLYQSLDTSLGTPLTCTN